MSKGAEAKYDQKQMLVERKNQEILRSKVRHITSAIKDGREANSKPIDKKNVTECQNSAKEQERSTKQNHKS
jgi:hypothetical protein